MGVDAARSAGPLRVLMLSTDLQPGGFPLRLVRMALRLPAEGITPIVGCLAPRGPLHADLEAAGIETFACDARGRFDLGCLRRFARHVRRSHADLVHAGLFHANLAARLFGRWDRPRPVLTSTATIELERRWHRWVESATAGLSDLHAANSAAVARHLVDELGFDPSRVVVVPNGLDFAEIDRVRPAERSALELPSDVPLIVWAGRMDPIKGLETFVEAVAAVQRSVNALALMIGDGPRRPALAEAVRRRGLENVVRLAGWRPDVVAWLKASDVLLFPSRTEGSPNVVLEAMTAGCAVVASDVPACRDLITPGRNGLLCPVDDAEAMAAAVLSLVDDRELRRRLSAAASGDIRARHDLGSVVAALAGTYRELAVGPSGATGPSPGSASATSY